jgi:precorrin-2 dehydrogenase/sirohydrochlorin ferrochelatase
VGREGGSLDPWMPIMMRVDGLRVLVLGGGSVGERRALQLAARGARVRVAALDFTPRLVEASRRGLLETLRVDLQRDGLLERLIENADLVVIATSDPELNARAASLALSKGKLVNDATKARRGNVIVPFHAYIDEIGVWIAATSLGRSGVAARLALEKCSNMLAGDVELRTVSRVMSELKEWLLDVEPDPKRRLPIYYTVAGDAEFRRLAREGREREARERAFALARLALSEAPSD